MEVYTFAYRDGLGWDARALPDWDSDRTLVLVFACSKFLTQSGPIEDLANRYPNAHILGCSAAGEVLGGDLLEGGVSVSLVRFESTCITSACESLQAPLLAGRRVAELVTGDETRAILAFAAGGCSKGGAAMAAFSDAVGNSIALAGGLAARGPALGNSFVIHGGRLLTGTICAVGLAGPKVSMGLASKGGWDHYGQRHIITRAENNILYELDGTPALSVFDEYRREEQVGPQEIQRCPLAVAVDASRTNYLVQEVVGVNEALGSLTFRDELPHDAECRFIYGNADRLVSAAHQAARDSLPEGDTSKLTISMSCMGRKMALGNRAHEEAESIMDALPPVARMIGLYSRGVVSTNPLGIRGLRSQLVTVATLHEDT